MEILLNKMCKVSFLFSIQDSASVLYSNTQRHIEYLIFIFIIRRRGEVLDVALLDRMRQLVVTLTGPLVEH